MRYVVRVFTVIPGPTSRDREPPRDNRSHPTVEKLNVETLGGSTRRTSTLLGRAQRCSAPLLIIQQATPAATVTGSRSRPLWCHAMYDPVVVARTRSLSFAGFGWPFLGCDLRLNGSGLTDSFRAVDLFVVAGFSFWMCIWFFFQTAWIYNDFVSFIWWNFIVCLTMRFLSKNFRSLCINSVIFTFLFIVKILYVVLFPDKTIH